MADLPSPHRPILLNGKHSVELEDDLTIIRFVGTYEPEEARELVALLERLRPQRPVQYLLVDLAQVTKPPGPATRRVLAEWTPVAQIYVAYFGGNWIMKTIGILMQSAMRLVSKQQLQIHFVETEVQARAWLAKQRETAVAGG